MLPGRPPTQPRLTAKAAEYSEEADSYATNFLPSSVSTMTTARAADFGQHNTELGDQIANHATSGGGAMTSTTLSGNNVSHANYDSYYGPANTWNRCQTVVALANHHDHVHVSSTLSFSELPS